MQHLLLYFLPIQVQSENLSARLIDGLTSEIIYLRPELRPEPPDSLRQSLRQPEYPIPHPVMRGCYSYPFNTILGYVSTMKAEC